VSQVKTLGVVGAGAMGAGIAQIGLTSGLDVVLFDLNAEALAKAKTDIVSRIARLAEKGAISVEDAASAQSRLTLARSVADFAKTDIVIEAIIERLEPKQSLFKALEEVVTPTAILASNTSSLSVAAIAAGVKHKERVCGLHFFNPVPLMKLVEVIVAPATSQQVAETATAFSHAIGKTPVTVKDGPGFLVNLQGRAYAQEGLHIVQEGVTDSATVDRIMRDGAAFRMGPFELMDLTGIDVNFPATSFIYQGYQHDPRLKTTTLHELMFNAGRFGRKTGRGYFEYENPPPAYQQPAAGAKRGFSARLPEIDSGFDLLRAECGLSEGDGFNLIAPIGEDAASACARLGLDPAKTVAIDFTAKDRKHLTLMSALGGAGAVAEVADWLRGNGFTVETIKDSHGFVLQRMLAMVANLGCELAQIGVGAPKDIDVAMKLAQNYPKGPLEWADYLGPKRIYDILRQCQEISGSDRYRPSLWLRRRALLGRPIHEAD
jgi:3-hydroxybutyryl-CoA dehydrogenase